MESCDKSKRRWGRMRPKPTCKVCDNAQSKYKCPSCLRPYCSLSCFKKHKQFPRASTHLPQHNSSPATVMDPEKPYYVDDPTELLQQFQLESLASSSEIHDILEDEKLQKLISDINSSAEPERELDKAMEVGCIPHIH